MHNQTVFDGANEFVDMTNNFVTRTTMLQSTGTFFVRVTPDGTPVDTTYRMRLTLVRNASFETEPNNTSATAQALTATGRAAGVINPAADVDFFSFTAAANELVVFHVHGNTPGVSLGAGYTQYGSVVSALATIFNTNGTTVLTTASRATAARRPQGVSQLDVSIQIAFVAPSAGTYFLSMADSGGVGGATRHYAITRQ